MSVTGLWICSRGGDDLVGGRREIEVRSQGGKPRFKGSLLISCELGSRLKWSWSSLG